MGPLFQALYYEFGYDHDSSYVEIGSTIADLYLQDAQCPLLLKSVCDQQTYRPTEKKWQFRGRYILQYTQLFEQSLVAISRNSVSEISVTKNVNCTPFKT